MKQFLILLLFSLTGFSSLTGQTTLTHAVDFTVVDIEDRSHHLFDYLDQGYHVLLMFYYTDCNPCIGSVPGLNAAFEEYGCNKGNLKVISIDFNDGKEKVEQFVNQYGFLVPTVSGLDGGGNDVVYDYEILAYPTTVLIAPDHSILAQDIYPVTLDNIQGAIEILTDLTPYTEGCYVTGISNTSEQRPGKLQINVSPNPVADGQLSLEFYLPQAGKLFLTVRDLMGRSRTRQSIGHFNPGLQSYSFMLPQMPRGTYMIELQSTSGHTYLSLFQVF